MADAGAPPSPELPIPPSLRGWLGGHGLLALGIGAVLLLAPEALLGRLGWTVVDPVTSRLLGAVLLALGRMSLSARYGDAAIIRPTLAALALGAGAGILGAFVAIGRGAPQAAWVLLSSLLVLAGVWTHYVIRLRQLAAGVAANAFAGSPAEDDGDDGDNGDGPPGDAG